MISEQFATICDLVDEMDEKGIRKAIKFVSPKITVKATLRHYRCYGGKTRRRKEENIEMLCTIGRPNYEERKLIRQYIKAGEPFPIKKVKLYFLKKDKEANRQTP